MTEAQRAVGPEEVALNASTVSRASVHQHHLVLTTQEPPYTRGDVTQGRGRVHGFWSQTLLD